MRVRSVVKGMLTFIPGLNSLGRQGRNLGGHTASAAYCYSVWLKHLTFMGERGMHAVPPTVAELGPGGSIGVGVAALLSGAHRYVSLDVVSHTSTERNLAVFDELVRLFRARAPRPDKGWPDFDPYLDAGLFPSHLLTPELLADALAPQRIEHLRHAVAHPESKESAAAIRYIAPWSDADIIDENSVDLIVSHSVLEHVVDLQATYRALYKWLRGGGWMSHQIDFKSHGLSSEWNGYRRHSEFTWKMILGRRPFLINRAPCSVHLDHMRKLGFHIACELKYQRQDGIPRSQLAARWLALSDDDLQCSGLFVQARKPPH